MEIAEFVETLKNKIDRLHKCKSYWKQFMIIRGIFLLYNRFSLLFPYHECIVDVDAIVLRKCNEMLDQTLNTFEKYTTDQQRYLTTYFIPTTKKTIENFYERKKRLLLFLAAKGICSDLRRYIVEFMY